MILYFIVGKRKSGTSLLFNSTVGIWKPALKDRSWNEVCQQVKDFVLSKHSVGTIAKADALMDGNRVLLMLARFPFIRLVVVDRDIKQRFRSYIHHRAKSRSDLAGDILGFYNEELAYRSNIARIGKYVSISYDELTKGGDNEFLKEVGYVQSERKYNASSSNWVLFGLIRSLANTSYYQRVHRWRIIKVAKGIYFERFASRVKRPYCTIYTNDIENTGRVYEGLANSIKSVQRTGIIAAKIMVFINRFLNRPSFLFLISENHFDIFNGISRSILDDKEIVSFYNEIF